MEKLAKKLNIQLIVFTSIEKKDLYSFFDTTISMYKDKYGLNNDGILNLIKMETKTGSISVKPRILPKKQKITKFTKN